jgi:hypothetical protein
MSRRLIVFKRAQSPHREQNFRAASVPRERSGVEITACVFNLLRFKSPRALSIRLLTNLRVWFHSQVVFRGACSCRAASRFGAGVGHSACSAATAAVIASGRQAAQRPADLHASARSGCGRRNGVWRHLLLVDQRCSSVGVRNEPDHARAFLNLAPSQHDPDFLDKLASLLDDRQKALVRRYVELFVQIEASQRDSLYDEAVAFWRRVTEPTSA